MPNGQAKIKFNAAYLKRLDKAVWSTEILLKRVPPKLKAGRVGDRDRVVSALWCIKQYAYVNTNANPFSDDHTIIKHDEVSVRKIRNSKQSLKTLFGTLMPDKQSENKGGYAMTLDLFNQFETVLTELALAG